MPASPSRYERTRCYRRGWAFERAGWVAMAAIVIGGAAGVFGDGWLGSARASNGNLTVEYPRFARSQAPLALTVEWAATQPETVLWVARSYLDRFEVDEITPPPLSVSAGTERIYYAFLARDGETRMAATFTLKPRNAGLLQGSFGVELGTEVAARHWVFP